MRFVPRAVSKLTQRCNLISKKILWLSALTVAIVLGAGYLLWTTSPLYAFQEAVTAAQEHDLPKFRNRFDVEGFVVSLLDDLLVQPAETIPGLSSLQREVCRGAVTIAKATLEAQMVRAIERTVSADHSRTFGFLGEQPANASEQIAPGEIGNLLKVTASELGGSVGRMSRVVFARMQRYAETHRNTTPGRLLACRPEERARELQRMLSEFGLTPNNFRGVSSYRTTCDATGHETCHAGILFFSPKASRNVTITLELTKGSMFSDWQVRRLVALPEFFREQGEDYDAEMHELMFNSLADINEQSVHNQMRDLTDRIKQNRSARDLLNKLHIR